MNSDATLYIWPDIVIRNVVPWDRDVFAKMKIELNVERGRVTLATLDPTDTDGFAGALGSWVYNATFRG